MEAAFKSTLLRANQKTALGKAIARMEGLYLWGIWMAVPCYPLGFLLHQFHAFFLSLISQFPPVPLLQYSSSKFPSFHPPPSRPCRSRLRPVRVPNRWSHVPQGQYWDQGGGGDQNQYFLCPTHLCCQPAELFLDFFLFHKYSNFTPPI